MATPRRGPARFPAAQTALLVLGAVYLTWGIVGFFLGDPAADLSGNDTNHGRRGLETNGLQNFTHIAMGLVALVCASKETAMRVGGMILAVAGHHRPRADAHTGRQSGDPRGT
jgi:threonine/homoserine/homoserine lactone efflux protein